MSENQLQNGIREEFLETRHRAMTLTFERTQQNFNGHETAWMRNFWQSCITLWRKLRLQSCSIGEIGPFGKKYMTLTLERGLLKFNGRRRARMHNVLPSLMKIWPKLPPQSCFIAEIGHFFYLCDLAVTLTSVRFLPKFNGRDFTPGRSFLQILIKFGPKLWPGSCVKIQETHGYKSKRSNILRKKFFSK